MSTVDACLRGLPSTLKIGAYDWTGVIEETPHETDCGRAEFEFRRLHFWPSNLTGPGHAVGIVLHECLHVVYDVQGLEHLKRGKDDREEQIILGFEVGLVSLFRDNPRLLKWMQKWLTITSAR